MCTHASRRRLLWNARQSTGSPRSVGRSWKWRREEEDANGAWCRKPWESAPVSTTASAWHHQQQPIVIFPNNKQTKKQHALSFLPFHTLSFVSATSQKKLQPKSERERSATQQKNRRRRKTSFSIVTENVRQIFSLSVCGIPPRRRRAITSADEILLSCYY